jgi:hypothetical protein
VNHRLAGPTIFLKSCAVVITSVNRASRVGVFASTFLPSVDGGNVPPG